MFATLLLVVYFTTLLPATAASLLRDPDIEYGLTKLASPVLRAAGLNPRRVRVIVVNDSSLNAFVLDGRTIFVHYGLILKIDSPIMLQAVIAHEAAHISNGHIARRTENMRNANNIAKLGTAVAIIAGAAGAGEAAGGIAMGTSSAAIRGFLAHTRAEEAAADRSAANYMSQSGLNPQGLVDLHKTFAGQVSVTVGRQDPYMRSHPLTRDRIRAAEDYVAKYGSSATARPDDEYWFRRIQGKLSSFKRSPKWTFQKISKEPIADVRLMRQAIAHHLMNDLESAHKAINAALHERPDDPFYYELKGQILLENRKIELALPAYETAVSLAPRNSQILGGYGRALLAADRPKAAIEQLESARARDSKDVRILHDLALAYAHAGDNGMASLYTAERFAFQGRMKDAGIQARRATRLLPQGSAPWQRAQDVLSASEQFSKRKKRR